MYSHMRIRVEVCLYTMKKVFDWWVQRRLLVEVNAN